MSKDAISTQQFVDISEIHDGVVILKNGGMRRVLMVSGVNFDLKSEEEQNAIIGSYQNFLNSLDFSLQLVVHSRKLNIESYLKNLNDRKDNEANELLRDQISEYSEFIRSFVAQNEIMAKNFYVAVPFDPVTISEGAKKIFGGLPFFSSKGKDENKGEKEKSFSEKVSQLDQRTDEVMTGLSGVGLRAVILNDEELVELFYNLYNPQAIEKKDLKIVKQ